MKKSLFLAALTLVVLFSCKKDNNNAPTPTDVHLNSGLLLYLPFDGNMADSSGNGNPTTAVGGASLTYDEHGKINSAFGGTGNGERILVTNNGSIKFDTAFSISVDFMMRSNANRQAIVTMVANNTGFGPGFILSASTPGQANLDFGVPDSTNSCENFAPGGPLTDTTSFIPAPESWYNVVAIFHKGTAQVYVNGKLISTKGGGSTTAQVCPNSQVIIGGWWQSDPISINGKMDEVRLYNRVLNADEIAQLAKEFQ